MSNSKITPYVLGGFIGTAFAMILSFSMGWIITSGAASANVSEASAQAVKAALVPVCVHQFNAQADAAEKLAALRELGQWKREEFLTEAGLASMPGSDSTVRGVARDCAEQLIEAKS